MPEAPAEGNRRTSLVRRRCRQSVGEGAASRKTARATSQGVRYVRGAALVPVDVRSRMREGLVPSYSRTSTLEARLGGRVVLCR